MLNRFMVVGTLFVILSLQASSVLAFSHNDPNPGWGSQPQEVELDWRKEPFHNILKFLQ